MHTSNDGRSAHAQLTQNGCKMLGQHDYHHFVPKSRQQDVVAVKSYLICLYFLQFPYYGWYKFFGLWFMFKSSRRQKSTALFSIFYSTEAQREENQIGNCVKGPRIMHNPIHICDALVTLTQCKFFGLWFPQFDSRPGRGLNIWVTFFPAKVHSAFHPPGVGKMSTSIHGPI